MNESMREQLRGEKMIPRDEKRVAAQRLISGHEMRERPGPPSKWMREHEAGLLMELVRLAHESGLKFVGWPDITLHTDTVAGPSAYYGAELMLRAEVKCVPA